MVSLNLCKEYLKMMTFKIAVLQTSKNGCFLDLPVYAVFSVFGRTSLVFCLTELMLSVTGNLRQWSSRYCLWMVSYKLLTSSSATAERPHCRVG